VLSLMSVIQLAQLVWSKSCGLAYVPCSGIQKLR
jgi:hypothetical protein